jgi:hypothetical protein
MSNLDVAKGLDLIGRKTPPIACCPRCELDTPLISTMVFSQAEFYCLDCGGHFGFLDPRGAEPTPELEAKLAELRAEWEEHDGRRLIVEGRQALSEKHQADHDATMAWLQERKRS